MWRHARVTTHLDARKGVREHIALLDEPTKQRAHYRQRIGGRARREVASKWSPIRCSAWSRRADPALAWRRPTQKRPIGDCVFGREGRQGAAALDNRPKHQALGLLAIGTLSGRCFMHGKPRLPSIAIVGRIERAGPARCAKRASRSVDLARQPPALPRHHAPRLGDGNELAGARGQFRMSREERLDVTGARLAETTNRTPPAAPARHPHGQIRERRDAVIAQRPRRTSRQPLLDVVRDVRLWKRERA